MAFGYNYFCAFLFQDAFVNGLNSMTPENQIAAYETLISRVLDVVAPRTFSYFPQELSLSLNIIERLTAALTTMYNNQQYSSLVSNW